MSGGMPRAGLPALELYAYQKRWLADKARFKVGMMARQTGKTFTNTLELVDDVHANWAEGRRVRWVILSRGERQSREAMNDVKRHAQAYGAALTDMDYEFEGGGAKYKALEVAFPNDSRITALPAHPDTARGFSANVLLDEFAFHQDSRAIWRAVFPVVSAASKLRVISTPNGKNNKFYELMTAADSIWSRHTVDIYQAVADGLPRHIDELRAGIADEDAWAQEYELEWLDEALAWLPYDLIASCEHEHAGDPARYEGHPVYIGNDIAARNDLWVAWVLEPIGDVLWTREVKVLKRASFAEQDATMDELFERYRVARLAMDQTGMGEKPVEDAKRRYGARRVEGVLFTGPVKLLLASAGKEAFEDRKIRIPEGDVALRADLHSLQKVVGPTGAPRLVAERKGGSHADRAWACFLAVNAAVGPAWSAGYEPAPRSRPMDEGRSAGDERDWLDDAADAREDHEDGRLRETGAW